MSDRSRIDAARRRANVANRLLAIGSAAAFAAVLVVVRVTHPGHATRAGATSVTRAARSADDGVVLDGGSIAPSNGAAPQVQTSVS